MKGRTFVSCLLLIALAGFGVAVPGDESNKTRTVDSDTRPWSKAEFAEYWFAGEAEIVRYELEQARYGEIHKGDVVMIFVTEDFLPEKQVKADGTDRSATGAWPVLKLNFTRKFTTGLYPYSMMTSIFTPIDIVEHPRTLKTTTSVQEWCGHTFVQLNLTDEGYRARGFSYFESEGDGDVILPETWLEDELWTRIRLDPESLPVGSFRMIPGAQQHRLRHRPLAACDAEATLTEKKGRIMEYALSYPTEGRSLTIRFQKWAPHLIQEWDETYRSGREDLTTRARRTHLLKDAYWNRNRRSDSSLREKLGL